MSIMWDLTVASFLIALSCLLFWKARPAPLQLPPGPAPDMFIGHARKIPFHRAWEVYGSWKEIYGDVIYARALGHSIVVLNSFAAARDLLETKSKAFSDRPAMPVLNLMGWGLILPMLPYGSRFRKQRRIIQQSFSPQAILAYRPIQDREVLKFLQRLMKSPDKFMKHLHTYIASILISVAYGHEVISEKDPYVKLVEKALHMTTGAAGDIGITSLDLIPMLCHLPSWLPGMGLKRHAKQTRAAVHSAMTIPLEELKAKRATGVSTPSVVSDLLEKYDEKGGIDPEHEEDILNIGGAIYNAGTDTTTSSLMVFFIMMALHPEVMKRGQEEIDKVVGTDRLPTMDDRNNMPYINCIVKELYRIQPPVPTCVPHLSTETEVYRGWTIPKDTIAIPNIWRMMREESVFPNAEAFLPERYLNKLKLGMDDGTNDDASKEVPGLVVEDDPSTMVFGFGRRVCPGKYLADGSLWLAAANILAVFDIAPSKNPETGAMEPLKFEVDDRSIVRPKPFKCSITPRPGRWTEDAIMAY